MCCSRRSTAASFVPKLLHVPACFTAPRILIGIFAERRTRCINSTNCIRPMMRASSTAHSAIEVPNDDVQSPVAHCHRQQAMCREDRERVTCRMSLLHIAKLIRRMRNSEVTVDLHEHPRTALNCNRQRSCRALRRWRSSAIRGIEASTDLQPQGRRLLPSVMTRILSQILFLLSRRRIVLESNLQN